MWLWSFTWQQWFYWLKSLPMAFILKDFFPRSNVKCSKIDFFFFSPHCEAWRSLFATHNYCSLYESAHLNTSEIQTVLIQGSCSFQFTVSTRICLDFTLMVCADFLESSQGRICDVLQCLSHTNKFWHILQTFAPLLLLQLVLQDRYVLLDVLSNDSILVGMQIFKKYTHYCRIPCIFFFSFLKKSEYLQIAFSAAVYVASPPSQREGGEPAPGFSSVSVFVRGHTAALAFFLAVHL